MYKILIIFFGLQFFGFSQLSVRAAYRAYYMEVYDLILNNSWQIVTGFTPKNYLASLRKDDNIRATVKASWICPGDTAYQRVCPMPKAIDPKFKVGERILVKLDLHLTSDWIGVVELVLWRADLRSNIYGIRFLGHQNLYGSYYEKDLALLDEQSAFNSNQN